METVCVHRAALPAVPPLSRVCEWQAMTSLTVLPKGYISSCTVKTRADAVRMDGREATSRPTCWGRGVLLTETTGKSSFGDLKATNNDCFFLCADLTLQLKHRRMAWVANEICLLFFKVVGVHWGGNTSPDCIRLPRRSHHKPLDFPDGGTQCPELHHPETSPWGFWLHSPEDKLSVCESRTKAARFKAPCDPGKGGSRRKSVRTKRCTVLLFSVCRRMSPPIPSTFNTRLLRHLPSCNERSRASGLLGPWL